MIVIPLLVWICLCQFGLSLFGTSLLRFSLFGLFVGPLCLDSPCLEDVFFYIVCNYSAPLATRSERSVSSRICGADGMLNKYIYLTITE